MISSLSVPDHGFQPRSEALERANAFRALCADARVRLLRSSFGNYNPSVPLADLVAAEANFAGYPANGALVTAAGEPYRGEEDEYVVTLPSVQFNHGGGTPPVSQTIGGAFIVSEAGDLLAVYRFPEAVFMTDAESSLVLSLSAKFAVNRAE